MAKLIAVQTAYRTFPDGPIVDGDITYVNPDYVAYVRHTGKGLSEIVLMTGATRNTIWVRESEATKFWNKCR